jgi:hypothetical protein
MSDARTYEVGVTQRVMKSRRTINHGNLHSMERECKKFCLAFSVTTITNGQLELAMLRFVCLKCLHVSQSY